MLYVQWLKALYIFYILLAIFFMYILMSVIKNESILKSDHCISFIEKIWIRLILKKS
jgi:hypothetical protein